MPCFVGDYAFDFLIILTIENAGFLSNSNSFPEFYMFLIFSN
ncbi:hypothetical protein QE431_003750 [Flavobacterium sp. SORGH_AS 622]|nr:hypothetical protein [Flavobacterium sp. SORGH_AS_0622]